MSDNPRYQSSCVNRSPTKDQQQQQCPQELPQPLPPCGDVGAPAFKIEEHLNEVYERRLAEINEQANDDPVLKEITYKEWIATLRQINKTLITNIQDIDRETTERLALLQRRASANCRFGQGDLCKCRKDMASLMQLVRQARRTGDWSVDKFNFETITEQDIFGNESPYDQSMKYEPDCSKQSSPSDPRSCANQKSKLIANVKALAFEVADKHDEIRDLKKQILSMEDEIQNAQKKIQLKDDVIRELRSDLKALPKCTHWGAKIGVPNPCCIQMDPKSSDSYQSSIPNTSSCYSNRDSINSSSCNPIDCSFALNITEDEYEEEEFIKCLKEELNQLFEMRRNHDQNVEEQRRAIEDQQNRLGDMVDKLLKSNNDFQSRLKYYRRELLNLENPESSRTITYCSDGDSGISSDSDPDIKMVNSVRNRISFLVEENHRLKRDEQCLRVKFEDVNCKAKVTAELLDKTSKALREVADALTNATCQPIAYENIFGDCQNMTNNPIVDAVDKLMDMLKERENMVSELKNQITNTGKINQELESNSQKLKAELCDLKQSMSTSFSQSDNRCMLLQNKQFSKRLLKEAEKYQDVNSGTQQDNQREYLKMIDDLSSELNTLSHQVNMVQSEFPTDEVAKQFETSLQGLEAQNDLLQSAVESLIEERNTIERTLKAENEDLKAALCDRKQELCGLKNQVAQLQQKPCERCSQSECAQREDRRQTPREDRRATPRNASPPEELQKLEYELRRKSKTVESLQQENVRLNQELAEIRRGHAKAKLLERQRAASSTCRVGSDDQDATAKFNALQDKSREQCKALQKAFKDIASLQQEIDDLRANEESFNKERDLLQAELIALKESQACQLGTQQSLDEQLKGTINELYGAKEKLRECMQSRDYLQNVHSEDLKRFHRLNAEMIEKYNNLVEDFNQLQKEYQRILEIEQEKTNQIRAFNAWKEEQIQVEKQVRKKMELFENHIKEMLEDKQNLLDRLKQTENDNRTLLQAIDQFKTYPASNQKAASPSCPSRGYTVVAATSSTNPVSNVIENVRNTTRKLSQQRCILEDEARRFFPQ